MIIMWSNYRLIIDLLVLVCYTSSCPLYLNQRVLFEIKAVVVLLEKRRRVYTFLSKAHLNVDRRDA